MNSRTWNSRTWFGAKLRRPPGESQLIAMLPPTPRPEAPLADAAGADGEQGGGWTVGLWRGNDLPPLRLSIRPQSDARMALRFDHARFDPRGEPTLPESSARSRAEPGQECC